MSNKLKAALAAAQLLPAIIAAVRGAESDDPSPGAGKTKLAVVLAAIEAIYATVTEGAALWDEVRPIVARIVDRLVDTFNSLGVFKTSPKAA